jgi:hypothetical protein
MRIVLSVAILISSAALAYAGPVAAPEIDGPAGLAALSAVGAFVAFIWERRRSRAK